MSINLTDGMSTSGGMSMSPQILSGSMEFTDNQVLNVTPASTQFNLVGDFTIEAWVYPTYLNSGNWGIFDARVSGGTASPWAFLLQNTSGTYTIMFFDGDYNYGTNTVPLNVWSHIAVVRSGGVLTYYLNGEVDTVFSSYGTGAISPGSTNPVVGVKDQSAGSLGTVGNISNLRIVNGVAVYTSAFTPSTSPLTVIQPANFNGNPSSQIFSTQTTLLLNTDDNGFNWVDKSTNNFVLTGPNMPTTSALSPFAGSMLFNGTSDYLTVASNPVLGFGTGDFTVECWVNWNSLTTSAIFDNQTNGGFNLYYDAGVYLSNYLVVSNRYTNQIAYAWTPTIDTWYHIAISRSGTDLRMFIDGTLVTTTTGDTTEYQAGVYNIGSDQGAGGWYLNGNLSNLRVVKGVAVYTSNFITPSNVLSCTQGANVNGFPSAAISSSQTSLLLTSQNNNNSYLVDSSIYQNIISGPLMPQPNGFNPLGFSGSLLVNGVDQYLTVSGPIGPQGTEDYTLEFWTYQPSYSYGNYPRLFQGSSGSGFNANWVGDVLQLTFFPSIPMGDYAGQWVHVATCRQGTTAYAFLNGQLVDTNYSADAYLEPGDGNWTLFQPQGGGPAGNFSNFRIVRGIAVYTSDFVVSRNPLTAKQSANQNGFPSAAIPGTQTSLLLNTNNNGNYLYDSSTYHYTLTAIGSPVASDMQPNFIVNGSTLFNGTDQYLTAPSNTVYEFGTGDFTLEGWYNFNSFGIDNALILLGTGAIGGANYSAWWLRYYTGSGGPFLQLYRYAGGAEENYTFSLGSALSTNQWYHIACARSGTDLRMFLNGTQVDITQTCSTDYTIVNGDPLQIGKVITGNGTFYLDGYVSNIRVVKGEAVYTETFTVPTSPLTNIQNANTNGNPSSAITGSQTSLLLNTYNSNLNRVDNSTHNFLVTSPNTPITDSSAPTFTNGSSLYNGKYYSIPYSEYGNLLDQNGAWTIEAWVYLTGIGNAGTILWGMNGVFWGVNWSVNIANRFVASAPYIGSITSINEYSELNTWYHVALSSDGTTTRLFVNGNLEGTFNGTGGVVGFPGQNPLEIGNGFNGPYTYEIIGNLSNFRVVKGVAVYTTNFTPPTNDLTAVQDANTNGYPSAAITGFQTSLLLNSTNNVLNNFDSSTHQLFVGCTTNPVPAAWNPYNLGSISFNGTSDLLSLPLDFLVLGSSNFTIEAWVYPLVDTPFVFFVGQSDLSTASGSQIICYAGNSAPTSDLYLGGGGFGVASPSPAINTWSHIAYVRNGLTWATYLNGTAVNSVYCSGSINNGSTAYPPTIGGVSTGSNYFDGDMSNFRIVTGVAVYTGNFTPPNKPLSVSQPSGTNISKVLPNQTNLLLNSPDSPNNLLDTSIYNLTVTPTGTPTAIVNNPFGPL